MYSFAVAQEGIECHFKGFSLICLPITLTVLAAGDYWLNLEAVLLYTIATESVQTFSCMYFT